MVSHLEDTHLVVLRGHGDGTFDVPTAYPIEYYTPSLAIGDVDGDGVPDVVTAHPLGEMALLRGKVGGTFLPAETIGGPKE